MSIQTRLILSLSALVLVLVSGIMLVFQWHFDRGLLDYVNAQQQQQLQKVSSELAMHWRTDPDWNELRDEPQRFHRMLEQATLSAGESPRAFPSGNDLERGPRHGSQGDYLSDAGGRFGNERPLRPRAEPGRGGPRPPPIMLLDTSHQVLMGPPQGLGEQPLEAAIEVDGRVVGYVATPRASRLQQEIDRKFRADQLHILWQLGGMALLLAIMAAVLLARYFTRPLRQLSYAAHRLTQQQYDIDVDSERKDELGTLARDISELSRTLVKNTTARQRWFADISHELRTPLAVLSGEIDAILDGVRALDRERMVSLKQEVSHLQRLVEDLYVLARADLGALHYHKQTFDFSGLVRERIEAAESRFKQAGLQVDMHLPDAALELVGDEDRLQQLIDNLLANSQRYTTHGGCVRVTLRAHGKFAELCVEDSAPGVPMAALPKLFDHLFRVDEARSRHSGGAGLGLAIVKRIVEAHGGQVNATASALGGLCVMVRLPLGLVLR